MADEPVGSVLRRVDLAAGIHVAVLVGQPRCRVVGRRPGRIMTVAHSLEGPAAPVPGTAGRGLPAQRRLRKLVLKRGACIRELALKFRGLVLQVSEALVLEANIVFKVRSHCLTSCGLPDDPSMTRPTVNPPRPARCPQPPRPAAGGDA